MPSTPKIDELRAELDRERVRLLQCVKALTEAQLDFRPGADQWSIADVLHHLALADEANVRIADLMLARPLPADPTPAGSVLSCLDRFRERTREKLVAPERVCPRGALPAAQSLARLAAARSELGARLARLAGLDLGQFSLPHPLLGPFDGWQWLLMAARHEGRHAAQIERVKASAGYPGQG